MVNELMEPFDETRPHNEWRNGEQFGDSVKTELYQRQIDNKMVRAN